MLEIPFRFVEVCVRRAWVSLLALVFAVMASACGDEPAPAAPSVASPFHHVEMEGGGSHRAIGTPGVTLQLRASAVFEDGSRTDVTNEAAWSVNDARVATVAPRGLVTAVGPGLVTVTATFRERSSVANLRVTEEPRPQFAVTGVVRGEGGAPVAAAQLVVAGLGVGHADAAGRFTLVRPSGPVNFVVAALGHADATVSLPDLTAPMTVDVRLEPTPGSFIERTVTGRFQTYEDGGVGVAVLPISTRAGGTFDAQVVAEHCDYNGSLSLEAENGGTRHTGTALVSGYCNARVRFVAADSRVLLTIRGFKAGPYRLSFREPR
jgi:hypothetical protein